MRARFIVRGGAKWSIGSSASIPILNEPWLPNGECIRSDIPGAHFVSNFNINSLMNLHEKSWNEHTVRQVVNVDIAYKILQTPLISQVDADRVIWKAERNGRYSVSSAYRLCVSDNTFEISLTPLSHYRKPLLIGEWYKLSASNVNCTKF